MISEHTSPVSALGGSDGGAQIVYVGQVARHLALSGREVEVLIQRDEPDPTEVLDWRNRVRIVNVPAGPPAPILKEAMLGLIHANLFSSGLLAAEVSAVTNVPFAVITQALDPVAGLAQNEVVCFPSEREAIEARAIREGALVIAECPPDRDDVIGINEVDPARIREMSSGVESAIFAPVPRAVPGLSEDEFLVLQVGRMGPKKGVDAAIRAVARYRAAGDRYALEGGRRDRVAIRTECRPGTGD